MHFQAKLPCFRRLETMLGGRFWPRITAKVFSQYFMNVVWAQCPKKVGFWHPLHFYRPILKKCTSDWPFLETAEIALLPQNDHAKFDLRHAMLLKLNKHAPVPRRSFANTLARSGEFLWELQSSLTDIFALWRICEGKWRVGLAKKLCLRKYFRHAPKNLKPT